MSEDRFEMEFTKEALERNIAASKEIQAVPESARAVHKKRAADTFIKAWRHSRNIFRDEFLNAIKSHPDYKADNFHPFIPFEEVTIEDGPNAGNVRRPIAYLHAGWWKSNELGPDNDGGSLDFFTEDDDEIPSPPLWDQLWQKWGEAAAAAKENVVDPVVETVDPTDKLKKIAVYGGITLAVATGIVVTTIIVSRR